MSCPARGASGTVLAPAGHPGVDQPGIAGQHLVGSDAEPLQHAGPQPLDEHVRGIEQAQQHVPPVGRLQVDRDTGPAAVERILRRVHDQPAATRAVDPDDVGAQLGEQHAGVGSGAQPGQFDDAEARQRAGGGLHARTVATGGE